MSPSDVSALAQPLREDQVIRYARHVLVPDVGGIGQRRLLAATVVVDVGAGPAPLAAIPYLAAAGVGQLVLSGDPHAAVTANEARAGLVYGVADAGRPRISAIADRDAAINPDVRVVAAGLPHADAPRLSPAGAGAVWGAAGVRQPDVLADALVAGGAAAVRVIAAIARGRPGEQPA